MFYLLLVIILNANIIITYCEDHATSSSFLGSAEQVHRKSRVSRDFLQINNGKNIDHDDDDVLNIDTITTVHADSSTIPTNNFDLSKDGIENYKNYFEADPKNLTEQQKTLLERIVDRAARFGGFNNTELSDEKLHENEGRATSSNQNQNKQILNKNKVKSSITTRRPLSATKATTKRISPQTSSGTSSMLRTTNKPSTTSASTKTTFNTEAQMKTTGSNQKYIETSFKPHNLNRNNTIVKNPVVTGGNNVAAAATAATIATSSYALNENTQSSDGSNIDLNTMKKTNDIIYPDNVTTASLIDSLSRDHAGENFYVRERPQSDNNKNKKNPQTGTVKPTKYHYYPHNQHIYLLPECAIQQVCNAVYVRLNYTQPLCACPSRYRDPCSASLNEDDLHTTKLIGDENRKAITLAKTCESTTEMRECRSPKDWSILALQNTRTGKSHYLVICRCPDSFKLEGPMAHDQPTYASVPGIRVFGMMCVKPGVPIRRPSVQPPKRFQQTKPFYTQPSSSIVYTEATLPQRPASYQYLGRPGSPTSTAASYLDKIPLSTFASSNYGRENLSNRRTKRTINDDDDIPEIPWERVKELKDSIFWD